MISDDLKKYSLPDTPGVYMFVGERGKILYIGKATSLRSRVRSYFTSDIAQKRGAHIAQMVAEARRIRWQETDSVLEAVVREAALIKKHTPPYNTKEKDDKSFNYVVITDEAYPRVLLVRAKDLFGGSAAYAKKNIGKVKYTFGPFPQGGVLKEVLKIVRKIFPFRDRCTPAAEKKGGEQKPCFNRQIGLCPGVCTGEITKREYGKIIQNIRLFFEGKNKMLIKKLTAEMMRMARKQEFEKAAEIKKTIFALEHIQDIALLKSGFYEQSASRREIVEAYDVAHLSGKAMVGVMVAVGSSGRLLTDRYRKFKIRSVRIPNDTAALTEILRRRLRHPEWGIPSIIVVDGGVAQKRAAERAIEEEGFAIPVVGVVKDKKHNPKDIIGDASIVATHRKTILLANSEAHRFAITYHRKIRGKLA